MLFAWTWGKGLDLDGGEVEPSESLNSLPSGEKICAGRSLAPASVRYL